MRDALRRRVQALTRPRTPEAVASDEPDRVAEAAVRLGLKHVVITSVTRDDLPDGGAAHFAACIRAVRARTGSAVEVLTPDFGGDTAAIDVVIDAKSTRSPSSCARVLAPGGRYVTVGGNAGSLLGLAVWGRLVGRRTGTRLSLVMLKANADMDAVVELYDSGVLRPRIDSVRPLAQIADAMARFGRGEHRGKVVVEID